MRIVLGAIAVSAALIATDASAQGVNLTGPYRCMQGCVAARPGDIAFVTQNGWELNLVNEAGQASRGWVDYPGRIWVARANMGAIYSPDGMTIQFDNGTIWQRAPEVPPGPRRAGVAGELAAGPAIRRAGVRTRLRHPSYLRSERGQAPRFAAGAWPCLHDC
jgi:hypothetical protein